MHVNQPTIHYLCLPPLSLQTSSLIKMTAAKTNNPTNEKLCKMSTHLVIKYLIKSLFKRLFTQFCAFFINCNLFLICFKNYHITMSFKCESNVTRAWDLEKNLSPNRIWTHNLPNTITHLSMYFKVISNCCWQAACIFLKQLTILVTVTPCLH